MTRTYCDEQYPDNPLLCCSLDPEHLCDQHEAWDEHGRVIVSWPNEPEDAA